MKLDRPKLDLRQCSLWNELPSRLMAIDRTMLHGPIVFQKGGHHLFLWQPILVFNYVFFKKKTVQAQISPN